MAVAHVVPGEGGHVLVVERLLDEQMVELIHLLLSLVHPEIWLEFSRNLGHDC